MACEPALAGLRGNSRRFPICPSLANSHIDANGYRAPNATHSPTPKPHTWTPTVILTPTIPPEARLKIQWLNIATALPSNLASNGILILDSWVDTHNAIKLDMTSGTKTQVNQLNEKLISFAVSPNRKWLAYYQVLYDNAGNQEIGENLVIATADCQRQKVIPWEKEWRSITAWLDVIASLSRRLLSRGMC